MVKTAARANRKEKAKKGKAKRATAMWVDFMALRTTIGKKPIQRRVVERRLKDGNVTHETHGKPQEQKAIP